MQRGVFFADDGGGDGAVPRQFEQECPKHSILKKSSLLFPPTSFKPIEPAFQRRTGPRSNRQSNAGWWGR